MNRFQEAIDIQNAVNPVAIAGVLHKQMLEVQRENQSTATILEDDAVKMVLYKLMGMCHEFPLDDRYAEAYHRCRIEAEKEWQREEADAALQTSTVG